MSVIDRLNLATLISTNEIMLHLKLKMISLELFIDSN